MPLLRGKIILLVLPKSQFREEELESLRPSLVKEGVRVIVLTKTGRELRGMKNTRLQPDGILVDWDKQPGIRGKYAAVLVLGGKGSAKSLWDDPILPQILTDHHRAGKLVGAISESVVVIAKSGLVQGSCPAPNDLKTRRMLEELGVKPLDRPFSISDRVLIAKNAASELVVQKVLEEIGRVLLNGSAEN
tara:strand:- start:166 stop:735 length:570 start_codon:yes stop_codon:yes gene_type:complete